MAQNNKAKAANEPDSLSARLNEVQDKTDAAKADAAKLGGPPPLPGAKAGSQKPAGDKSESGLKPKAAPPPIPSKTESANSKSKNADKTNEPNDTGLKPGVLRPRASEKIDPVPAAVKPDKSANEDYANSAARRREAQRRPAGPPRERLAANDDAPSIGGLIYALNQRPSKRPFGYAAGATGLWTAVALGFAWSFMLEGLPADAGVAQVVTHPAFLTSVALWIGPITLFWFLSFLAWRTEELHLRSSAMTEVAVRLAEPDRMAEQSVASLGQAVRRQVSFMNDAVSRALGRAGELEALVHNEVSQLEHSYEENERKIRGLIQELSGERHALVNTGDRFKDTLQQLGTEVPQLIERLSQQQYTLAKIIEGAGANLTQLETSLSGQTNRLESALDGNAGRLQTVLEDYTQALATALGSRTEQMQTVLGGYTEALGTALGSRTEQMQVMLTDQRTGIEEAIATGAAGVQKAAEVNREVVDRSLETLNTTLENRAETMQIVFEEYSRALDTTLANRTDNFDIQLVERTKALDEAFSERLRLFDEAIMNSAIQIDNAVGSSTEVLASAMSTHAQELNSTLTQQANQLDETLVRRIEAVRASSENISRQSIKAIEGLAGQSDMLRNVSENLLGQINNVSNRFESQSHAIMRSANALESANFKIDKMLGDRSTELNETLERMSHRADELGNAVQGYSNTLEGSISEAEQRARLLTQDMTRQTEERAKAAVDDMERLKQEASIEAERALADLRSEFSTVSREVTQRLGSLSKEFSQTSGVVREEAARAAQQLEVEQTRLKHQMERLPGATQESANAMRKALRDQLKALDQLSSLATSTAQRAAVVPPSSQQPIPLRETPVPERTPAQPETPARSASSDRQLALGSLTDKLRTELQQRSQARTGHPAAPAAGSGSATASISPATPAAAGSTPGADGEATQDSSDAKWSFGDLLARASDAPGAAPEPIEPEAFETSRPSQNTTNTLDVTAISRALDRATASAIWSRFRSGQRGFMVRSIYSPDGRKLFDDVVYRYQHNDAFRQNVDRFLLEFEQTMRDADKRDSSGEETHALIMGDAGRVYLLLAHAAKRLV